MEQISKKQIFVTALVSVLISSFFIVLFVSAQSYIRPEGLRVGKGTPPTKGGILDGGLIAGWKYSNLSDTALLIRAGRVGIGLPPDVAPQAELHVVGNSSASGICLPLVPGGAVECRDAWDKFGTMLVNRAHTARTCLELGGFARYADSGNIVCNFKGAGVSCPSGWNQFNQWSATGPNTCRGAQLDGCHLIGAEDTCTTGSHGWSNTGVEACEYADRGGANCDQLTNHRFCRATVTEIACY